MKLLLARLITLLSIIPLLCLTLTQAEEIDLSIEQYIELATQNDTVFEEILIRRLPLQYQRALQLPAGDLILAVKEQYDFNISSDSSKPESLISLSKLFPFSGTSISAKYQNKPTFTSSGNLSEFSFTLTQSIANNAFGKNTRLRDEIIGLEIDLAQHQITEAYEDYLAAQLYNYYSWYAAYRDLEISKSSYQENLKLLENINERQSSKIALPIDVNKIKVQVINKKENLIKAEEDYENQLNLIKTAMRYKGKDQLVPKASNVYRSPPDSFKKAYDSFKSQSRTYEVLDLLHEKSILDIDESADGLLPSVDLLLGYKIRGNKSTFENSDRLAFGGISMEWPIPNQVEKATYQILKIEKKQTELNIGNAHYELYATLQNLLLSITREKRLAESAEEKIKLSEAILKDETENYSYGRVTLNDYIRAVNTLDSNRFNKVSHDAQLRILIIEWLRLTDQLIQKTP